MPARKTKHVRFEVHFVVEFEDKEPFDSIGSVMGPPDIDAFIAAGMKALGVEKGNILGGSRFGMNLYFPRLQSAPEAPAKITAKATKPSVKKARKRVPK